MRKHIPSLNGLRAISILMVIIGHIDQKNLNDFFYSRWPMLIDAQLGVNVFFVISGFLITTLLLQEEAQTQTISLKSFYIKRSFRIFPIYYTLLGVYLVLQLIGLLQFTAQSWLTALTYTKYLNWHADWEMGHLWSLSIEEQFYLLWPFVFKFARKYRMHFAFAIILIVPALRMLYVKNQYEWMNDLTLFQRVDAIMWGCVFAMYHDKLLAFTQRMAAKAKFWLWIPFLAIPALSAFSLLNHYYDMHLGWLIVPFGNTTGTIADIAIGFIILITIHYSNNIVFKTLNAKPLDYIGKLSYSLYIWQQIFFSAKLGFTDMFPLNVVLIAIVALMSFYLIEKPFLKLRFKVLPE